MPLATVLKVMLLPGQAKLSVGPTAVRMAFSESVAAVEGAEPQLLLTRTSYEATSPAEAALML